MSKWIHQAQTNIDKVIARQTDLHGFRTIISPTLMRTLAAAENGTTLVTSDEKEGDSSESQTARNRRIYKRSYAVSSDQYLFHMND